MSEKIDFECDCHVICTDKNGEEYKVKTIPSSYWTTLEKPLDGHCGKCGGIIKLMKV